MPDDIHLHELHKSHLARVHAINEASLPWVGQVSPTELDALFDLSDHAWGVSVAGTLQGFALCIPPNTHYASPNYRWFSQQFEDFFYVDRIAIDPETRRNGIGEWPQCGPSTGRIVDVPMLAEVMKRPPNHASLMANAGFRK